MRKYWRPDVVVVSEPYYEVYELECLNSTHGKAWESLVDPACLQVLGKPKTHKQDNQYVLTRKLGMVIASLRAAASKSSFLLWVWGG